MWCTCSWTVLTRIAPAFLPVDTIVITLGFAGVAVVVAWASVAVAREIRALRTDHVRERTLHLLALFAPGTAAAADDPRALLAWQPLAATARTLFPEEFALLDSASGVTFPFGPDHIQAAHARWTAEWLAWELAHDAEFKLKAAAAERELLDEGGPLSRARLELVEREKLERYQRRYEEYVRVGKGLQALAEAGAKRQR